MKSLQKNSVSLAGEFAVLSQLALRGINANMTLGNTKGVDILVSNPETGLMFKVEVKTHYQNRPSHSKLLGHTLCWIMSNKHEVIIDSNLLYCFTNIDKEARSFRFFIVPSQIVAKYVKESHQYWLSQGNVKNTSMRQFRLGLDNDGYTIETPRASEYENRWDYFLKNPETGLAI